MPTYEYRCNACGREFEYQQRMADPDLTKCEACNEDKLEKLISRTAFQLKGGGWYKDLYSSSKPAEAAKDSGTASTSTPSADKASTDKPSTDKAAAKTDGGGTGGSGGTGGTSGTSGGSSSGGSSSGGSSSGGSSSGGSTGGSSSSGSTGSSAAATSAS